MTENGKIQLASFVALVRQFGLTKAVQVLTDEFHVPQRVVNDLVIEYEQYWDSVQYHRGYSDGWAAFQDGVKRTIAENRSIPYREGYTDGWGDAAAERRQAESAR